MFKRLFKPLHRLLTLTCSIVLLCLVGPYSTAANPDAASIRSMEPDPSTLRMAQLLKTITRETDPMLSRFRNAERSERFKALLDAAKNPSDIFQYKSEYSRELLNSGLSEAARIELGEFEKLLLQSPIGQEPANRLLIAVLKATANLRMAEQINCLSNHTADSCIFPIRGRGIHIDQTGGREAVRILVEYLKTAPDNLEARWLLNVASMTIGEYPDKVPPQWLIPPSAFASGHDIKRFPDVAGPLGLDHEDLSGGVITDDFNQDGYLDILSSSMGLNSQLRLYLNNADGTFTERTREARIQGLTGGLNLIQADYDNDGDTDALVLRGGWMREGGMYPSSLLRNNGDGSFTDVTEAAGLLRRRPTQTAVWFDFNNDGLLDLFVGVESSGNMVLPCELYRNNGNGTFTECAKQSGASKVGYVKGVVSGDFNNDGLPDLYLSLLGRPNVLYRNDGPRDPAAGARSPWKFTDVALEAGVQKPMHSFPTWFFDYDNDGWQDLYVGGYRIDNTGAFAADALGLPHNAEKSQLYRNNRDGTFTDVSNLLPTRLLHGMGANFGDLDNDGWLDFYIATGDPDLATLIPNRMMRNDRSERFQDVTTSGGFGHLQKGHAVAFADLDNDGDHDIYHDLGGAYTGDVYRNVLFENPGHDNNWITLKLEGTRSNRSAIGARIQLMVNDGGKSRMIHRKVGSGGSFGASPLRQEIGLGKAGSVESVIVKWPSGLEQKFAGLQINRFHLLREGEPTARPLNLKSFRFDLSRPSKSHLHGSAR